MKKSRKLLAYSKIPTWRLIYKRFDNERHLKEEEESERDKRKKAFKHENTNNKIPRNFIGMDLQDIFEDTNSRRSKIHKTIAKEYTLKDLDSSSENKISKFSVHCNVARC